MALPRLNRLLVLEAPVRTPDGAGGFNETWTALGTVWAEVTSRTGTERDFAEATVSGAKYKIILRAAPFDSDRRPKPEQRFREGNRRFTIRAVLEADPKARFITCLADEEVSA
jgi:SPP1 family predicted phage head-tail adaptor